MRLLTCQISAERRPSVWIYKRVRTKTLKRVGVLNPLLTKRKMPHVIVKAIEGKSKEQLKGLVDGITKAFVDQGIGAKAVTVRLEEFPREQWMEKVYHVDVEHGPGQLMKGPEYDSV